MKQNFQRTKKKNFKLYHLILLVEKIIFFGCTSLTYPKFNLLNILSLIINTLKFLKFFFFKKKKKKKKKKKV